MDKELLLLNTVEGGPEMSQRELALKTGLSLGSVNILLKKMAREGFIKLEKMPSDRVAYMLTSKGFEEKLKKTKSYIQGHYRVLERMRQQIRQLFETLHLDGMTVLLCVEQIELGELIKQVAAEYSVKLVEIADDTCSYQVVIGDDNSPEETLYDYIRWVNIHDYFNIQ